MVIDEEMELGMKYHHSGSNQFQIPKRFIVTLLGFIGMFNIYAMRLNISVAISSMVNTSHSLPHNKTLYNEECPVKNAESMSFQDSEFKGKRYNWDSAIQNDVVGSFFYGFFISAIFSGYLAERFGGHIIFGGGIFLTSIFTLLTPISAQWGLVPLLIVRALVGFGEGVTFPAMASVISRWAPKLERSRINSIIFSGTEIGCVVTFMVSGWLCSTDFLGGWPSAFYVFGIISCIWFLLWGIFVYESPFKHPSITTDEIKLYIDNNKISKKSMRVPWINIIRSIPFWAYVLAFSGSVFTDAIIFTELPIYLSNVLHLDIEKVGLYSSLPFMLLCLGSWVSSYLADLLRKKGNLGITNIRKIFNSIGGYMIALSLLFIPFCGCRTWLVISVCSFGMFMNGCKYSGFQVSCVDMNPTYAGLVFGFANIIAAALCMVVPAIVGAFTESGDTIANWGKVFSTASVVSLTTTTLFALFSSAELQPWGTSECAKESNNF